MLTWPGVTIARTLRTYHWFTAVSCYAGNVGRKNDGQHGRACETRGALLLWFNASLVQYLEA
jgi:hypothetical protein